MVGACRASAAPPISHLPLRNPKNRRRIQYSHQTKPSAPISRAQTPNRRLFLLSLPLSGFLFLPFQAFGESDTEYDPVTPSERDASALISQRVSLGVELLEKGRELQAQGDFNGALQYFSQVFPPYLVSYGSLCKNYFYNGTGNETIRVNPKQTLISPLCINNLIKCL